MNTLNLNDLATLLASIDIAVKRGAFSILEVGSVGEVATKLNSFLQEAQKQAQAEAEASAEGQAPAEGDTPAQPEAPAEGQAQA
jgi:hypothetical protein